MAQLDLLPGPAALLEATRGPIGEDLGGEEHMRLGGGTALEARWHHRVSTDVDLFVEDGHYRRLYANQDRFVRDMKSHLGEGTIIDLNRGFAKIVCVDGGEISVGTTPEITEDPWSSDTARGTRGAA